jgi:adenosylhomocysteine nucleosidase
MILACALAVEERAAHRAGARTALVGLGAGLPPPDGRLVSFGFAGALVPGLDPGTLVTAERVVDGDGRALWEGEPIDVPGARRVVLCAVDRIANEPQARAALAERTGAHAVDMESGRLAATGRLAGVVRAISDTGKQPVGALARGANRGGGTDWLVVAKAFVTEPVQSTRTARAGVRALASLRRAAGSLR